MITFTYFIAALGLGTGFIALIAVNAYRKDMIMMQKQLDYLQSKAIDLSVEVILLKLINKV